MIDFTGYSRFESIDEVRKVFTNGGSNEIELTYDGKEYFLASEVENGEIFEFTIALNHQNRNPLSYKSLDDILDNYKEEGKPLRDFILNMNVEFIYGVNPEDM